MRLTPEEARTRLASHFHGVLCTLHPVRGADPVPVVFAVDGGDHLGIPIDRVKPKSTARLQREANLVADPRAALLVEHWDAGEWSRLWWVRAELRFVANPPPSVVEEIASRLAEAVAQYSHRPFHRVLVCRIVTVTGWAASG